MSINKRVVIRIPDKLETSKLVFEGSWQILENAFNKIYLGKSNEVSFEKVYFTVYSQVVKGRAAKLYGAIESYMRNKLQGICDSFAQETEIFDEINDRKFLSKLVTIWDEQCIKFKLISDIMIYMDKVYCKANRKLGINDMCFQQFKNVVICPMKEKIINLLDLLTSKIRKDRNIEGNEEVLAEMKKLISMLETLEEDKDNYFVTNIEADLVKKTGSYYLKKLSSKSSSLEEYLDVVGSIKTFESTLTQKFLNSDTSSKIITLLEKIVMEENSSLVLENFVRECIKNNDPVAFEKLYSLSFQQEFHQKILEALETCIKKDIDSISFNEVNKKKTLLADKFAASLKQLLFNYIKFLKPVSFNHFNISSENFNESQFYQTVIDKQFCIYLSTNANEKNEFLAVHIDSFMKSSKKSRDLDEKKRYLESIVDLLNLTSDKDVLELYLKQHLSKRLLQQRSSIELEVWFVQTMKTILGNFFTTKMEGMVRDIIASKESSELFFNTVNSSEKSINYNPQILTMSVWPFKDDKDTRVAEEVRLPANLASLQQQFESFYKQKYDQRLLSWSSKLSMMEIGYQFDNSYHDLIMPFYSAVIFLNFDFKQSLTYKDLLNLTAIPEKELQRHLLSLFFTSKTAILMKNPLVKQIQPDDIFTINNAFQFPTRKVKLQTISSVASNTKSESELELSGDQQLHKERLQKVNRVVVRLMKASRKLSHSNLLENTKANLSGDFILTKQQFEKSITYLVEKEYLHRDPDYPDLFHYLP